MLFVASKSIFKKVGKVQAKNVFISISTHICVQVLNLIFVFCFKNRLLYFLLDKKNFGIFLHLTSSENKTHHPCHLDSDCFHFYNPQIVAFD